VNSQQLFYFNLIVGVLFLAYFVLGRSKAKAPTKLNLRAASPIESSVQGSLVDPKISQSEPLRAQQSSLKQISEPKVSLLEPETSLSQVSSDKTESKQLSIFFIYNGHDWEAHQVLGIPQGASIDVATRAYQEQLKAADPMSYEFYEAAHAAIFKKRRNERL
jgi:hypothetical protein